MAKNQILESFGHRVRVLRQDKGLSQEELAHASGLDRSYVGQVERGERNIALENIYKLASGLGIEAHKLLMES
ncbi:helix-turn-helix domain-containing protein [Aeromonas hydrophila]|uniref:helix-turn-helix domain-containing protein n=1 Tax=Aeromonas TaxID=642 RepID=UPI002DB58299|nr:helix-turn-helix transcriptional regulator [Aeromonas caviae]MEB6641389.1 helix-turn-helix transcriptional regulator [Aeromonas caviae]